jgi:hypothetical protein
VKIKDLYKKVSEDEEGFRVHIADFLDEFYASGDFDKKKLFEEEVDLEAKLASDYQRAFIAAMTEKLCRDYGIDIPNWVYLDEFRLKKPFFLLNAKGDYQAYLIMDTPVEFKVRNIFIPGVSLTRV